MSEDLRNTIKLLKRTKELLENVGYSGDGDCHSCGAKWLPHTHDCELATLEEDLEKFLEYHEPKGSKRKA